MRLGISTRVLRLGSTGRTSEGCVCIGTEVRAWRLGCPRRPRCPRANERPARISGAPLGAFGQRWAMAFLRNCRAPVSSIQL